MFDDQRIALNEELFPFGDDRLELLDIVRQIETIHAHACSTSRTSKRFQGKIPLYHFFSKRKRPSMLLMAAEKFPWGLNALTTMRWAFWVACSRVFHSADDASRCSVRFPPAAGTIHRRESHNAARCLDQRPDDLMSSPLYRSGIGNCLFPVACKTARVRRGPTTTA